MSKVVLREYLTETFGVFGLVYFGGWSVLLATAGKIDVLCVGCIHSGILGILIWTGCAFAGCHFNPALTIGFIASKEIEVIKGVLYIIFQFFGTFLAAIALMYTAPTELLNSAVTAGVYLGGPHHNSVFSWVSACILELMGTFLLMFTVKTLCAENKASLYAPLIGFVIGMCVLCFGSFTGTGINPFRYFGPALLSLQLYDSYIYILMPIVGAVCSSLVFDGLFNFKVDSDKSIPMVESSL